MIRILQVFNQVVATTIPSEMAIALADFPQIEMTMATYRFDQAILGRILKTKRTAVDIWTIPLSWVGTLLWFRQKKIWSEFDLIHTHHTRSSLAVFLSLFIPTFKRKKAIWCHTYHTDFRFLHLGQKAVLILPLLFADLLIANSETTLKSLPKWLHWYYGQRAHVGYNGIVLDDIARAKETSGPRQPWILCACRHVPQKDVGTLISAFARVLPEFPAWKLILLGGGPEHNKLKALAESLMISDKTEFRGFVPRSAVYAAMCQSSIIVSPSLYEGFCNSNIEALASGTPLVLSDIPVFREVIGESHAVYFKVGDSQALAESLRHLIQNQELRFSLSKSALDRAKTYSMDNASKRYFHLYCRHLDFTTALADRTSDHEHVRKNI